MRGPPQRVYTNASSRVTFKSILNNINNMNSIVQELKERFTPPNGQLAEEILLELQSILRLHQITVEELSWKWDAYCLKMGVEETKLDLKTIRDFKKDLQEILEKECREKVHKVSDKKVIASTPRTAVTNGDVFGIIDELVSNTPKRGAINGSATKRKSNFETPAPKANKNHAMSSPNGLSTPNATSTFADRKNAGDITETLNHHIELPNSNLEPAGAGIDGRIKLKANTEIAKFGYKTMAMKLSEASEILDDRIDEFIELVKEHHKLEEDSFGNASAQSPNEIIVVGRITSDSSEGKPNASSLMLETSRKTGAGLRVPLKIEGLSGYSFFPGQIVALKGTNASGEFFAASEVLDLPLLPPAASALTELETINARLLAKEDASDENAIEQLKPVTMLISSGPYTTEDNLDFSPLRTLLDTASSLQADVLILAGPFVDIEHPLIRTGDFDLPPNYPISPDKATLTDLFRYYISRPLTELTQAHQKISVILIPSIRDAVSKHASWPQDRLNRKDLALPKQVSIVTNPVTLSINEVVLSISSLDVLDQLRGSEIVSGKGGDLLARLCKHLIQQRHFFPVFPPSSSGTEVEGFRPLGPGLDVSYLKLGEWLNVRPDILVVPSLLLPFAKVVESVVSVNPGMLMKKRGPGTYARLTIRPLEKSEVNEEEEKRNQGFTGNRVWERCRVDIVRI